MHELPFKQRGLYPYHCEVIHITQFHALNMNLKLVFLVFKEFVQFLRVDYHVVQINLSTPRFL